MRPVDKRLLRASPAARSFLVACVPLGLLTALAIVVQATLLGRIVEQAFLARRSLAGVSGLLALLVAAALARGLLAWGFEAGGHLAASATAGAPPPPGGRRAPRGPARAPPAAGGGGAPHPRPAARRRRPYL